MSRHGLERERMIVVRGLMLGFFVSFAVLGVGWVSSHSPRTGHAATSAPHGDVWP